MKYLILFFLLFTHQAMAQDFSFFQKVLSKHLKEKPLEGGGYETHFDYDGAFQDQNSMEWVDEQSRILDGFEPKKLLNKNQALAFWINAYNFYMIKTILDRGFKGNKRHINSVKDLGSFLNPYAIFTKKRHPIGGELYSLDQMEKEILLGQEFKNKNWKDARIHFAVNCASKGCPPLLPKIYEAKSLDKTLDDNIRKALKSPRHFQVNGNEIKVTHLFKWYQKDFEEHSGSVLGFLNKYLKTPLTQVKKIRYIEYDWQLNQAL